MNDFLAKNLAFLLKGDKQAQTTLAQRIGVNQGTISKWSKLQEKDSRSEPEFRSMARLAAALGISLDDLAYRDLEAQGAQSSSQPVGPGDENMRQALELLYLMADARPEDRKFQRPTWAMVKIAAKALEFAEGSQREAMAEILKELAREV